MNRREWMLSASLGAFFARSALAAPAGIEATLIVEAGSGRVIRRDGPCAQRFTPCSTFKIPLALMGFDAGILHDPQHPALPYDPALKASARERRTSDPTVWLTESILWYSRHVTAALGPARFARYVEGFLYGNRDVSGTPGRSDGLTHSWLMSSLRISADEQVAFLDRMLKGQLPVSAGAVAQTVAACPVFAAGPWTVRGKTGSGWYDEGIGVINRDRPLGWFIGWAEQGDRRLLFARVEVRPGPAADHGGPRARTRLLAELAAL